MCMTLQMASYCKKFSFLLRSLIMKFKHNFMLFFFVHSYRVNFIPLNFERTWNVEDISKEFDSKHIPLIFTKIFLITLIFRNKKYLAKTEKIYMRNLFLFRHFFMRVQNIWEWTFHIFSENCSLSWTLVTLRWVKEQKTSLDLFRRHTRHLIHFILS